METGNLWSSGSPVGGDDHADSLRKVLCLDSKAFEQCPDVCLGTGNECGVMEGLEGADATVPLQDDVAPCVWYQASQ